MPLRPPDEILEFLEHAAWRLNEPVGPMPARHGSIVLLCVRRGAPRCEARGTRVAPHPTEGEIDLAFWPPGAGAAEYVVGRYGVGKRN